MWQSLRSKLSTAIGWLMTLKIVRVTKILGLTESQSPNAFQTVVTLHVSWYSDFSCLSCVTGPQGPNKAFPTCRTARPLIQDFSTVKTEVLSLRKAGQKGLITIKNVAISELLSGITKAHEHTLYSSVVLYNASNRLFVLHDRSTIFFSYPKGKLRFALHYSFCSIFICSNHIKSTA